MFLLIILRILFILKWLLQFIGVIIFIALLGWLPSDKKFIAICSLGFLIVPEVVMACVIWISQGVSAVSSRRFSSAIDVQSIPVFGKNLTVISFFSYIIVLISVGGVIGSIFEISILSTGVTLLLCLFLSNQLKQFVEQYLHINI